MSNQSNASIDAGQEVITLINVYEVEPERQDELVELLSQATERVMRRRPGFISVSVHKSLDGSRVANYAQWTTRENFAAMLADPEAQAEMRKLAEASKSVAPSIYRVVSVQTG